MTRYYLSLPDPKAARGSDANTSFKANGADGFASELQEALRSTQLFERWRGQQDDPDDIDQALAATDPNASVTGEQHDLRIDLVANTTLPASILRHRLRLLAGDGWQLRDVAA
ncbi:hypothetical protein LF41_1413 [Lysobacter dokdonensis DS-58]|uniref:Uncharacterized protein n=1 Tax=Lysobacter dokdonensis DS-58 TaxID=1300345 RepID=A0A0A2WYH2_9GAMM|nr:hypothetical protein [Lysobacter dokdonensis]KGQ18059.1 hypothetical protein LF41_1413 [Lysobacter dokdonensis DS-58]